jgi:hypothetical protein
MADVDKILKQLDTSVPDDFPTMDHPDNYVATVRLCAFGDGKTWAMTIEQLIFATCAGGYSKFRTWIYTYGNCLSGEPGLLSSNGVHPVTEGTDGPLLDIFYLRPNVHTVHIRGQLIRFDASIQEFSRRGVDAVSQERLGGWDLLRLLVLDHRQELLATDAERRKRIAEPLPQLLQLDEWHHPDITGGEKPSDTRCFRSLADVLAKGDPLLYKPTEPPNTDWRNWPRGGIL